MRAIRLSFFQMLAYMRRDMMLFFACLAPLLAGLFFRFGIPLLETALRKWLDMPAVLSPYYKLIDIFFSMLSPAMFCVVSAMVALEESDEKTAKYLFVTPLGKQGYLIARFGISSVAAFMVTFILLPVFKLSPLSVTDMMLLAISGTLQGIIIALFVLTFSSNKLEGMAATKLSTLVMFGAVIPLFIKGNIQFALSPLPSFWIGKAIYESKRVYMLPAFFLLVIWISLLLKQYLRKI